MKLLISLFIGLIVYVHGYQRSSGVSGLRMIIRETLTNPNQLKKLIVPQNIVPKKIDPLTLFTSGLAQSIRFGSGTKILDPVALTKSPRPQKPLLIYEYEASAASRLVREACSILDLVAEFRPCPNERSGFSDLMSTRTAGRRTVPFLIDDNPRIFKREIFKADAIIEYLFETYGPGKSAIPPTLKGELAILTSKIASAVRGNQGSRVSITARDDNLFRKPIDLWGFEGNPQVRLVRESLNSLSLAHRYIFCANGSANRDLLLQKTGKFDVPYIEDPNTGVKLFDAGAIIAYLEATYTSTEQD